MRTIHQGPRAPSPDSQAEYTQAIRPRYLPFFENALAFGGSPYTGLAVRGSYFLLRRTASSAMKANENATASNTTVERISTITTPQERQCGARFADFTPVAALAEMTP